MKRVSKSRGLKALRVIKDKFRALIRKDYEPKANDCNSCETEGSCCTDAHFVNVHVTRLEADAISGTISRLGPLVQRRILERNADAIKKYGLSGNGESFSRTYSCPLFEKGVGCLVHDEAKPLPCIHYACYDNEEDLPPHTLLEERERAIEHLNTIVYGNAWNWLPIPVWIEKLKS